MKNINFLNNGKLKKKIFLNSISPKQSLFFYFLNKWQFFNKKQNNFFKNEFFFILINKNRHNFHWYNNLSCSANQKIKTNIYIYKNLKKFKKPTTVKKLNFYL